MHLFKHGDWVVHTQSKRTCMITSGAIKAPENSPYTNTYNSTSGSIGNIDIQAWEPVIGELCVFWDNGSYYVIDEYVWSKANNGLNPKRFVANTSDRSYHNIAPLKYAYYIAAERGIYCE